MGMACIALRGRGATDRPGQSPLGESCGAPPTTPTNRASRQAVCGACRVAPR